MGKTVTGKEFDLLMEQLFNLSFEDYVEQVKELNKNVKFEWITLEEYAQKKHESQT